MATVLYVFGDSITHEASHIGQPTFVTRLYDTMGWDGENQDATPHRISRGIPFCSSERILYWVKKRKNAQMFVLFHAKPKFWFMPSFDRDANGYLSESELVRDYDNLQDVKYRRFPGSHHDRYQDCEPTPTDLIKHTQGTMQDLQYSPDLAVNRHNGALEMIDQYLLARNIPVIHCVKRDTLPSWMPAFKSGVTDYELADLQKHEKYGCSYTTWINAVTREGNDYMFDVLMGYVNQLRDRGFSIG